MTLVADIDLSLTFLFWLLTTFGRNVPAAVHLRRQKDAISRDVLRRIVVCLCRVTHRGRDA